MPPKRKMVRAYGRHTMRCVKIDAAWISPELKLQPAVKKLRSRNIFSSDSEHSEVDSIRTDNSSLFGLRNNELNGEQSDIENMSYGIYLADQRQAKAKDQQAKQQEVRGHCREALRDLDSSSSVYGASNSSTSSCDSSVFGKLLSSKPPKAPVEDGLQKNQPATRPQRKPRRQAWGHPETSSATTEQVPRALDLSRIENSGGSSGGPPLPSSLTAAADLPPRLVVPSPQLELAGGSEKRLEAGAAGLVDTSTPKLGDYCVTAQFVTVRNRRRAIPPSTPVGGFPLSPCLELPSEGQLSVGQGGGGGVEPGLVPTSVSPIPDQSMDVNTLSQSSWSGPTKKKQDGAVATQPLPALHHLAADRVWSHRSLGLRPCTVQLTPLHPSLAQCRPPADPRDSDRSLDSVCGDVFRLRIGDEAGDTEGAVASGDLTGGEEDALDRRKEKNKEIACLQATSLIEALSPLKPSKLSIINSSEKGFPPTPLDKVLLECCQSEVVSFNSCIPIKKGLKKIGEGTYGEVFQSINGRNQQVALKIIPVEGDQLVNGEPQKKLEEILQEIIITKELSALRHRTRNFTENFIEVHSVSLCRGAYPKRLLTEWDRYNKKYHSENDRPDMFDKSQLYVIFEFANGGEALESFEFDSLLQANSVLRQVAMALAVAEKELEFEHRDLHWGNVLVSATASKKVTYCLDSELQQIDTKGVKISIIDFTLSRLRKDGVTVFTNLATDQTLFEGDGDYQYDIYREMKKANGNNWEEMNLFSNVLWLHYLCQKLLDETDYYKSGYAEKRVRKALRQYFRETLQTHCSAEEVVKESGIF